MAGLGTTGTSTCLLVPNKPWAPNQCRVTVPSFTMSGKKSVAGVATLKPPKEDGGFICVRFASGRSAVPTYFRTGWPASKNPTLSSIILI